MKRNYNLKKMVQGVKDLNENIDGSTSGSGS